MVVTAIVIAAFTLLLFLPSLLLGNRTDHTCVDMKTNTALAVEGVASAEFSCEQSFEGSTQNGFVTVNANTETEVVKTMDKVLYAFATKSGMAATWRAPSEFKSQDGSIVVYPSALGFNGTPWVSDLRKHYGVN